MRSLETKRNEQGRLLINRIVRKIFIDDWAIKLTALVITFGLWFGVTGLSTSTTQQLKVPLNLSLSSSAEIINSSLQEVDIFISGDKRRFDELIKGNLIASLDLTDLPPGDHIVSLTPATVTVNLPQGIKFDAILQTRIFVRLEAVEERDVEVRAQTGGDLASGFQVYGLSPLPQRVRVRGPASYIKTLDFVETERIDLSGKNGDFTAKQVAVSVGNPKVVVLNSVVDVVVRIGEKRVEHSFSVPVSGEPGKIATFVLAGPRSLMSKASNEDFRVEMVVSETGEETPKLIIPAELQGVVEIVKLTVK